jgi:16S rRNA (uracil1498-N3)-methyltransferase
MPPRFYCPDLTASPALIEGDQLHHLRTVRRLGVGDEVELFDGRGRWALCRLTSLTRRLAEAEIVRTRDEPPPTWRLTVATAVPKGGRMDTLIEKVTELGATAVWPLDCRYSSVSDSGEGKQQSWHRRAVEACKQCGRLHVPRIEPPMSLEAAVGAARASGASVLLADPSAEALRPAEALAHVAQASEVVGFVGPEGGFTDQERQCIMESATVAVRLAPWVLRIETAAIALAALVTACRAGPAGMDVNAERSGGR